VAGTAGPKQIEWHTGEWKAAKCPARKSEKRRATNCADKPGICRCPYPRINPLIFLIKTKYYIRFIIYLEAKKGKYESTLTLFQLSGA